MYLYNTHLASKSKSFTYTRIWTWKGEKDEFTT